MAVAPYIAKSQCNANTASMLLQDPYDSFLDVIPHNAYYGVFQLVKHVLDNLGLDDNYFKRKYKNTNTSHVNIIHEFNAELEKLTDYKTASRFTNRLFVLKTLRTKADYKVSHIIKKEAKQSVDLNVELCKEINSHCSKYKLI